MPDIKDRNKREAELAAALLLLFRDYEDDLPTVNWTQFERDLEEVLGEQLADTYEAGFNTLKDELEFDLGNIDVPARAETWADEYAKKLAEMIAENSKKVQADDGDMEGQFDEDRAEKIAVTEVTRANTAGEFGVATTALALGLIGSLDDLGATWNTAEDEGVCEDCEPLNEAPQDEWSIPFPAGPPAHPNCRCWLSYSPEALESQQERLDRLIEVPDIRQHDHFSCGAASSMSVGNYFHVGPKTLPEWKKALGTDVQKSTHPTAICKYLTRLGLHVVAKGNVLTKDNKPINGWGGPMTIADLDKATKAGHPVIVCCQDYGPFVPKRAKFNYGHYLTVIGVGMGYIFCQDSSADNVVGNSGSVQAKGRVMIAASDFDKLWHDKDEKGNKFIHFGIEVSKPSKVLESNPEGINQYTEGTALPSPAMVGNAAKSMTADKLSSWAKQFGVSLSGSKGEMKKQLLEHIAGHTSKPGRTTPTGSIENHVKASTETTLSELYQKAKADHPSLTIGQFHDSLRDLHDSNKIELKPYTRAHAEIAGHREAMFHNGEVMYFARSKAKPTLESNPEGINQYTNGHYDKATGKITLPAALHYKHDDPEAIASSGIIKGSKVYGGISLTTNPDLKSHGKYRLTLTDQKAFNGAVPTGKSLPTHKITHVIDQFGNKHTAEEWNALPSGKPDPEHWGPFTQRADYFKDEMEWRVPHDVKIGAHVRESQALESEGPHKLASTQINTPEPTKTRLLQLGGMIAEDDLAEKGREDEPHVTIRYGFTIDDPIDALVILQDFPPVKLTLGATNIFPAKEDESQRGGAQYDVVYVEVDSPDLMKMNEALASLPHIDTFPKYIPHICLAYVKPGLGGKYASNHDLQGLEVVVDEAIFSPAEGGRSTTMLLGQPEVVAVVAEVAEPVIESFKFIPHPLQQRKKRAYTTIQVDVNKLDSEWSKDEAYYITKGADCLESTRLNHGKPIEQSVVSVTAAGRVLINAGGDRFAYVRDAGAKTIPVTVITKDAPKLVKLVGAAKKRAVLEAWTEAAREASAEARRKAFEDAETRSKVETALSNNPVKYTNKLSGGCNQIRLITMENGVKGVFKPVSGEKEGLRNTIPAGQYARREATAYAIAKLVGLDSVPPTVMRTIFNKEGSMQSFIEDAKPTTKVLVSKLATLGTDKDKLMEGAVFDFITGQTDRHMGNLMLDGKNNLHLIDNGLAFPNKAPNDTADNRFRGILEHHLIGTGALVRTVQNDPIPEHLRKTWANAGEGIIKTCRDHGISEEAIGLMMQRWDHVANSETLGEAFERMKDNEHDYVKPYAQAGNKTTKPIL